VKQYGLDLLGVMILFAEYKSLSTKKWGYVFFFLWCLLSNVGLFFIAAFLMVKFIQWILNDKRIWADFWGFIPYTLGPLMYVCYFVWYNQQPGSAELKQYMLDYWNWGFFPHSSAILGFGYMFLRLMGIYFFSSYLWVSWPSIVLVLVGLIIWVFRKEYKNQEFLLVALGALGIHFILNLLKAYPLADRLYLYWTPVFYFFMVSALAFLFRNKWWLGVFFAFGFIGFFWKNLPFKTNDVVSVYRFMESEKVNSFWCTEKAAQEIGYFHFFTEGAFVNDIKNEKFVFQNDVNALKGYVVSQVNPWFGHQNLRAPEEAEILKIKAKYTLELVHQVDGYNIYKLE
jgi:hypothetical protein